MPKLETHSTEETKAVARVFAQELLRDPLVGKKATVVALIGELGGGKTTFAQGFAQGLDVEGSVKSPTFVLMRRFPLIKKKFSDFYHLDCYRLEKEEEARTVGLPEVIANPRNLVLIEWAERVKNMLPRQTITISFSHVDEHTREINFN